jgi:hypothetical protein
MIQKIKNTTFCEKRDLPLLAVLTSLTRRLSLYVLLRVLPLC